MRGNVAQFMSPDDQEVGYKLLLYISYCLAGRAFPTGDIPSRQVRRVKWEVYKPIVARKGDREDEKDTFPFTRTLLHFDTREFLNVLSLAFDEEEYQDLDGPALPSRQVVVDILLEIMVIEPQKTGQTTFSPDQVGHLFTFLARQMARHEDSIQVDKRLFDQVLHFLSNPADASRHEERQQALLELLSAGGIKHFDEASLLRSAKQAQFWRVCELIYESRGEYGPILQCYLSDQARQRSAFPFIHHTLKDPKVTPRQRHIVVEAALGSMRTLIQIDADATAKLVLMDFLEDLPTIISLLKDSEQLQYQLLSGMIRMRADAEDPDALPIPPAMQERFVDLMCKVQPSSVLPYLRTNPEYRIDEMLDLCQRNKITDATAWLLEQKGDIAGAYSLVFSTLKARLGTFQEAFERLDRAARGSAPGGGAEVGGDTADAKALREEDASAFRNILFVTIEMCLRVSAKVDEVKRQSVWFSDPRRARRVADHNGRAAVVPAGETAVRDSHSRVCAQDCQQHDGLRLASLDSAEAPLKQVFCGALWGHQGRHHGHAHNMQV